MTFKAGDKTFDVDVKAGDSLQSIRKRINNDADNFGLSVNIMNTSDGKSKLMIDSGVSGSGKDLQITGNTTELTDNLVSKIDQAPGCSGCQDQGGWQHADQRDQYLLMAPSLGSS